MTGIRPGTVQIVVGVRYYDEDWREHTIEKICTVTVIRSQTAVITYKLTGGTYNGSTADIEETHTVGDVIQVHEAPSRTGYTFLYWQGSQYQPHRLVVCFAAVCVCGIRLVFIPAQKGWTIDVL